MDRVEHLLEREAAIGLIEVVLSQTLGGTGQVVLVEGPAGAGKTTLLNHAERLAADRGFDVLAATGELLEQAHLLGIVHQLVDPMLRSMPPTELEELFAGPARIAHEALLGEGPSGDARSESVATGLRSGALHNGVYWVLSRLADRKPLVVVVDDLQWADPSSLTCLYYLLRRADQMRVAFLLGSRPASDDETAGMVSRLRPLRRLHRVVPTPLSLEAVSQLVRQRVPDAGEEACAGAWRAAGGNPFLVGIAVQMLADGTSGPVVPGALLHEVEERLAQLATHEASLARAVAVLEPNATLDLAARLAGLDLPTARDALSSLLEHEWVEQVDGERPICLRHPLVRDAVLHISSAREMDLLHRRAMELLGDAGASIELVAVHAAATAPAASESTARVLLDAAAKAMRAGAPHEALALLRRAVAEPPSPIDAPAALEMLATAAAITGAADTAEHFAAATAAAGSAIDRSRLAFRQARHLISTQRSSEAVDVLAGALADLAGAEGRDGGGNERDEEATMLQAEIASMRLVALRMDPQRRDCWEEELARLDLRHLDPKASATRMLTAELAYRRGVAGEDRQVAIELLHQAIGGPDGHELAIVQPEAFVTAMHAALQTNEVAFAADVATRAMQLAQEVGYASTFRLTSTYLGALALRSGRLRDALGYAAITEDLVRDMPVFVPLNAATLITAYLELGSLEDAERELELPGGTSRFERELTFSGYVEALGWLRLAQGRPADALATFLQMSGDAPTLRGGHPATNHWRSGASRAAMALGDSKTAHHFAAIELELARPWGAPRALGISLTTSALVAPRRQALELLEEAVGVLEQSPDPMPLARALVERGTRRLAAGTSGAGRDDLRRALDITHRHEFRLLATEAEAALRRGGGRPRTRAMLGIDALTPAELRVARLAAASGKSNSDIAADLFVSRKAVEYHLSNAYRKLGISSRSALAQALEIEPSPA